MKNYSLYAHALHSRLQMIRNKLDINPILPPSDIVAINLKYFEKAGESVSKQHHYQCNRGDYHAAAELLLMTLNPEEQKIKDQPLWTIHKNDFYVIEVRGSGKDEWIPVTEEMAAGRLGGPKKMTHEEAMLVYRQMCKRTSSVNLRISKYHPG
ncbi:hypothetical protein [Dyadobacter sp. CY323]|uniref:hypothetical protein n=1 Tax=Dyadobacter sp. CY323 TaxID=2907302 RepID=UPI001F325CB9|nr:hypothetical protein [Dyadobacter sp. CY323]MCE6993080.1 hypothetical protein [Dyadobacter sp. CY323]